MTTTVFYDPARNTLYVSGIATPFPAGSLQAMRLGAQLAVANPADGTLLCAWADFGAWTIGGVSAFASADDAFAALQVACTTKRVVGSPERNYALPPASGQPVFPLSPAPVDVNTIALVVNGVAYYPPDIAVSALAVTWQGPFPLDPTDATRVVYF